MDNLNVILAKELVEHINKGEFEEALIMLVPTMRAKAKNHLLVARKTAEAYLPESQSFLTNLDKFLEML